MSLYDDVIKKMIFGMPKTAKQAATRGLLGRGGEFGQGKIQGLLGSDDFRQGLGLISAGFRGKGLQEAMLDQARINRTRIGKQKLVRARDTRTGKDVFVTQNDILSNPGIFTPIPQQTMMGESEFSKEVGRTYGKQYSNIQTAAGRAAENKPIIDQARTLLNESSNLVTGIDANLRLTGQRIANALGLDINIQNVTAAELLQQSTGDLVLNDLGKFKGAISDGERQFAINKNANLGQTKEGLRIRLDILERTGQINQKYAEAARDWVERNGSLQNRDRASKQSWEVFSRSFQRDNPLITPELRTKIQNASKAKSEFAKQENVKVINGKTYIKKNGEWFEEKNNK